MTSESRDFSAWDKIKRVGDTSVFCDWGIVEVDFSCMVIIEFDIFEDGAESDSIINFRFFLLLQSDDFSIAASFNIEDTSWTF